MARQQLGLKKVTALRARFPHLDIVGAMTRGGTDHRIDMLLRDGSIWNLYSDGSVQKDGTGWSGDMTELLSYNQAEWCKRARFKL